MSFTLIEYEQYTEASAYGDTVTCHALAVHAESERIFKGRVDTTSEGEYNYNMSKPYVPTLQELADLLAQTANDYRRQGDVSQTAADALLDVRATILTMIEQEES